MFFSKSVNIKNEKKNKEERKNERNITERGNPTSNGLTHCGKASHVYV
jgi:hypothetical protein